MGPDQRRRMGRNLQVGRLGHVMAPNQALIGRPPRHRKLPAQPSQGANGMLGMRQAMRPGMEVVVAGGQPGRLRAERGGLVCELLPGKSPGVLHSTRKTR